MSNRREFIKACQEGNLDLIKWFVEEKHVDPFLGDYIAILWAAGGGHVNIVKFLLTQPGVDPAVLENSAIRWAFNDFASQPVSEKKNVDTKQHLKTD